MPPTLAQRIYATVVESSNPEDNHRLPHLLWGDFVTFLLEYRGTGPQRDHESYENHGTLVRDRIIRRLCGGLCDAAADAQNHVERLDERLSELLQTEWRLERSTEVVAVAKEVTDIIERLNPELLPLPERAMQICPASYFNKDRKSWDTMSVVAHIPTTLIRIVIVNVIERKITRWSPVLTVSRILNSVATMIEICMSMSSRRAAVDEQPQRVPWLVATAFLWAFWQRLRTLQIYFHLGYQLLHGLDHGDERSEWVANFFFTPGLSLRAFTVDMAARTKSENMCAWAFELIRGDPLCLGLDFRIFHNRFQQVFGHIPPRCRLGSRLPCDGLHSDNCRRYKGLTVKDQSMHNNEVGHDHAREEKLRWDEDSYRNITGARAVSIGETDAHHGRSRRLKYCQASGKTLAFSHVWAHGQGGRPEDGINSCLHARYARLAREMGCDSYWIDSACIPENHELRKEAIMQINSVFYNSRAVMVYDQDLMRVDMSENTVVGMEGLLAGLLLCDWNMRAWTLLEAVKGRQRVFILCKDRAVNVLELIQGVYDRGRIDMVVFAALLPHLLPWNRPSVDTGETELPLELAGSWLSHRPASRTGDDIVIWSLMLGQNRTAVDTATEFWKSQSTVNTGFLMSSAERLTKPGWSWAPKSPFAARSQGDGRGTTAPFFRPLLNAETETAQITAEGIWAMWWVYKFDSGLRSRLKRAIGPMSRTDEELDRIRRLFLTRHRYGALLQPVVSLTSPVEYTEQQNTSSGARTGILLAVCVSTKKEKQTTPLETWRRHGWWSYQWVWQGVYEWPVSIPLPAFQRDYSLWIG